MGRKRVLQKVENERNIVLFYFFNFQKGLIFFYDIFGCDACEEEHQ